MILYGKHVLFILLENVTSEENAVCKISRITLHLITVLITNKIEGLHFCDLLIIQ